MRVESGPAKTDMIWQIIRAALFVGVGAYFLYDGLHGYPQANVEKAREKLQSPALFKGEITYEELEPAPTKDQFDQLVKQTPTNREQVVKALGEPEFVREEGPGAVTEFYISQYGYATVKVVRGQVDHATMTWTKWYKSKEEIFIQFVCAIVAFIPGVYFLWRIYKAATLHAVVDDAGMTYGSRRIPFDKMVSLRDYNPKGWIDLYYQRDGKEKRLRIDNEKILRFDEIVAAICEAKGFRNEVREHFEQKAREEADTQENAAEEPAANEGEQPDREQDTSSS